MYKRQSPQRGGGSSVVLGASFRGPQHGWGSSVVLGVFAGAAVLLIAVFLPGPRRAERAAAMSDTPGAPRTTAAVDAGAGAGTVDAGAGAGATSGAMVPEPENAGQ